MRVIVLALLVQFGLLTAPDPAQMENAPDLGYVPVPHTLSLPEGMTMGAATSVALGSRGQLVVFNRGDHPLMEFDRDGRFVRAMGEGLYARPHGMRLDADDNIWTTDVNTHLVIKMSPRGEVLLTLGVRGESGEWNEAAGQRLLNQPNDVAIAANGDVFVMQGHGRGESRVLKFDRTGRFITSWGGNGAGPGQFNTGHSIVIDAQGLVYVADRENRRVQIFDQHGTYRREWTFKGLPCGLYIDPAGQMHLVTGFSGQILRLDANGKATAAMGQPGKGLGEFGEAHYMSLGPNGEIYVADTVNRALHKFIRK
jgi:sugar lactone lactonase YvrE